VANTAWIIRIYKVPGVGWRALKPVFSNTYKGKPLLTTRAIFRGAEIHTPGGHFEIEWYENGKRQRQRLGDDPAEAKKALAKQILKMQAVEAGIAVADVQPKNGKRPIKQAVEEFLAEKKRTKAKKTHQALKQVLDLFVQVVGRNYLEDVKRSDRQVANATGRTLDVQGLSRTGGRRLHLTTQSMRLFYANNSQ
jgi:hypothetical protein